MGAKSKNLIKINVESRGFLLGAGRGRKGTEILSVEEDNNESIVVGYITLSKFDSSYDSQLKLVEKLFALEGFDVESEDDMFYFDRYVNGEYYDGDYSLVHGGRRVQDMGDCEEINGRVDHYNEFVDYDFWREGESCIKEHLKEIDKDEKLAVYHRKGKDWYVGKSISSDDGYIVYHEEGYDYEKGEYEEEYYECYYTVSGEDISKKQAEIVEVLKSYKKDYDARSYVYNELHLGDGSYYNDNDDLWWKLNLMMGEDGGYDYKNIIFESLDFKDYKDSFRNIVEKEIDERVKVSSRLMITVREISDIFALGDGRVVVYNELALMKRLGASNGYELVYSQHENSDSFDWAIKELASGEEYHFKIEDIIGEDIPGLIEYYLFQIHKRINLRVADEEFDKLKTRVFIGFGDNYNAGNCDTGINEFIVRHSLNREKIGGIRGDVLMEMENSQYTRGAVMAAILARGLEA